MSKSIFNHLNRATRARHLFTVRRRRRVSFKRPVAKVKPSRTRRPRQLAQLLPVLEAALFMQELASEATSNLGLDGMVSGRQPSRPSTFSFLARLHSWDLALGQSIGSIWTSVQSAGTRRVQMP